MSDEEETYTVPLIDQRYFGAGIKKKRIAFVPSSHDTPHAHDAYDPAQTVKTAAQRYLDIVSPPDAAVLDRDDNEIAESSSFPQGLDESDARLDLKPIANVGAKVCNKCKLPMTDLSQGHMHASSLAHQTCLQHIHPPSSMNRSRKGLTIMQSSGWDPDERKGLGVSGQGRLFPVKASLKDDKQGIGHKASVAATKVVKPQKLDAGKMQKLHKDDRKRHEQLGRMFYGHDDLAKYLG